MAAAKENVVNPSDCRDFLNIPAAPQTSSFGAPRWFRGGGAASTSGLLQRLNGPADPANIGLQDRQGDFAMRRTRAIAGISLSAAFAASGAALAWAVEPVDEDYVRSLASAGKTVLVMEYRDATGVVNKRRGFASPAGFASLSATDFRVDGRTAIHLYGIEPCQGDMVNEREDYSGSCEAYAREGLDTLLQGARVIFCRAFLSEENAPVQDATCYGYYNYPDVLDAIHMLEEQLVSVGAHRIARRPDGSPLRGDLDEAEAIGRQGYGMWADPGISAR